MTELTQTQLAFRQAMAGLPAAVNIITTAGEHGIGGITVSAVSSVTDSPPTVLVCVNGNSAMHRVFAGNGRVGISVLSGAQEQLALHFAGITKVPMQERFAWDVWQDLDGIPVLRDAAVTLVGRIASDLVVGTHSVFFVEIDAIATSDDATGLVYFRRAFRAVTSPGHATGPDWLFYDEWSDPLIASPHAVSTYDEAWVTGNGIGSHSAARAERTETETA